MAIARSIRRTNPITLILAALLAIGFFLFLFSPSSSASPTSPKSKHNPPASNPLSPPTAAYRKQAVQPNGRRIPPPVVHYQLNNLTTSPNPMANQETILILTPLARFYQEYWDNLIALTFPHELIALGFITPKTKEGNAATVALQNAVTQTQSGPQAKRFASVTIMRQDFDPPLTSQDEKERHKMENQRARRSALSQARNSLLFTTMGPSTAWILWLDSDVVETPPTLLQDLAGHNKPIIVANCMQRFTNEKGGKDIRPYDYNSWQDSQIAQDLAQKMGPDDILLEGYDEMATYRTLMAHLADPSPSRDQSRELQLDGVGGTALLVKAEVHRDGAMFPPFAFYHLMETEGFAKMAKRLGWTSWGLPNYFVYHYDE
ncbi:Golgi mannosyltransferase complex subunit [Ptychographa xylographoides]|nr:Golgi mannosyltransferase complex subunit [Ptychographa xylographoides]